MPTYIVLLGPPGVGKGTQAKLLAEATGLAHISSGDLFRTNIKNQTELGKLAQGYISCGDLVPDDVTIAMIRDRFRAEDCRKGAIMDGFPRTIAQADAFARLLAEFGGEVDHVPYIMAADEVLVERLGGRWTCRASGHVFHQKYNPPRQAGICDVDGSELYQRDDDKAETVRRRIQVYVEQTTPLIDYYRERGVLVEIDGARSVDEVSGDLLVALEKKR